ncbi:MAG: DUF4418 family protein [Oscillospiraceae bacterium]|jgi:hypothetical protein|nr:DUF4418 family protein [Oscillospiraceae bacterium]
MKNRLIGGGVTVLTGALLAAGPRTVFKICDQSHHAGHSTCFWTAQTTLGIGIVLALIGVAYVFFTDARIRAGLSLAAAGDVLFVLLTANVFIGVDSDPMMSCRLKTLPALNVISAAALVLSAVNVIWLLRGPARGGGEKVERTRTDAASPLA